jgi:sec-independent protein translocase protein TatA
MFGLGFGELVVIVIVLLLVFGAKRLPEIGKALGQSLGEFKSATELGLQNSDSAKTKNAKAKSAKATKSKSSKKKSSPKKKK